MGGSTMSIITQIFGKKETQGKKKSVLELTTEEKAALEDDKNSNVTANMSAMNTGLHIDTVYAYRKSMTARAANATTTPQTIDPQKAKQIIRENLEIQKLQLDCDKTIQQMQMDRLQFDQKLREWKQEILGDDAGTTEQMTIPEIIELLDKLQEMKTNGQESQDPGNNQTLPIQQPGETHQIPETNVSVQADDIPEVEMTDDELRQFIKNQDKKYIKMAKLLPDQLIADKINAQLPTLSEKSINRGIEILRSEF